MGSSGGQGSRSRLLPEVDGEAPAGLVMFVCKKNSKKLSIAASTSGNIGKTARLSKRLSGSARRVAWGMFVIRPSRCVLSPIRTLPHAYAPPCVLSPMHTLPHAYSPPCVLSPMRTLPPFVLSPMRTLAYAYSRLCVRSSMRTLPHAYSPSCILSPKLLIGTC